jgi:hypothetical protein
MPTNVGNSSNGAFKYLKDRVWKRVKGWIWNNPFLQEERRF